jgi:Uma2 family endonuclease/predicted DNA-binding transcriptional regulator AlpA
MFDNNNLITARTLADELDLSIETIWRYTREKRIPYIELGSKQYRYRLADVIEALGTSKVVKEQARGYRTGEDKLYTYQDYLEMPDEPGYRYEILNGILIKEPAPSVIHQRAIGELYEVLKEFFRGYDSDGEVFLSPLDVTFEDITVVQPDLLYISGDQEEIVEPVRVNGAPTLAVEVISPSSRRKDRLQKLQIYQKAGVEHYWIVDPEEKTLECFHLMNGIYSLIATGMDEDVVDHPIFQGLTIALKTLWGRRS